MGFGVERIQRLALGDGQLADRGSIDISGESALGVSALIIDFRQTERRGRELGIGRESLLEILLGCIQLALANINPAHGYLRGSLEASEVGTGIRRLPDDGIRLSRRIDGNRLYCGRGGGRGRRRELGHFLVDQGEACGRQLFRVIHHDSRIEELAGEIVV